LKLIKKNILDIGFGEGQNLLECKRRGANVYGIELREKKIKEMNLNFKINKKIFLEQT
jgi:2-polyprenyl-3-methyl-5-hydroxy-6-metoxy-1,4-benzoquinol methylase|tara:strand:+ start:130 stop:303 length:174 start_codon:yes stop_codon:yes gene_type:complete